MGEKYARVVIAYNSGNYEVSFEGNPTTWQWIAEEELSPATESPAGILAGADPTRVRHTFPSGMVRDSAKGKIDYTLSRDGPMYERWNALLAKGAAHYYPRNWMKADGREELERFRQSAIRHFEQWLRGDTDEDHAAAVFFNINGAEYVKARSLEQS